MVSSSLNGKLSLRDASHFCFLSSLTAGNCGSILNLVGIFSGKLFLQLPYFCRLGGDSCNSIFGRGTSPFFPQLVLCDLDNLLPESQGQEVSLQVIFYRR